MDLRKQFDEGQAALARLVRGEYDLTAALTPCEPVLGCIDEGIRRARLRLAGSGPYFGEQETIALVEKHGLNVGSHEECGAVLKYMDEVLKIEDPSAEQINEQARQWSENIARRAKTKAVELPLERPHHHIAVCAYYDGTGKMTGCGKLPLGFIVSRGVLPQKYAISEMVMATGIAFNHGFNERFTRDHPFALIALGNDEDHANELKDELIDHALSQLTQHEAGAVKVLAIHR
jgi:hypothetical protein